MSIVSQGARLRLQKLKDRNASGAILRSLWPQAMVHAAVGYSSRLGVESSRIKQVDVLPFASLVLCRKRPKEKVGKIEAKAYLAAYMHPCQYVPGGSTVIVLEKLTNSKLLVDEVFSMQKAQVAVTVREVHENGHYVFPALKVSSGGRLRNIWDVADSSLQEAWNL